MNLFAKYYDRLVGADYNKITNFIISAIKKFKPDAELVCDLGCGTATIALSLAENGYDMIAIDSSADMLSVAREKIIDKGIDSVLLLDQDICDFELYGTVDVIYSTLDTLNYITDKRDVKRLFSLVKNYLNHNGLFIFDINSEYKFMQKLGNNIFVYDDENEYCVWESNYDKKSGFCEHSLTFFESEADGYHRCDDYQLQRYYSSQYIETLIEKFGFTLLSKNDDYTDGKLKKSSERITYVLKINK